MILWVLTASLAAATAPVIETRKGFPHRDWGESVTINLPFDAAQACVVQSMMIGGQVTSVTVEGGADVYFGVGGLSSGPPFVRFLLRSRDDQTEITALYRHPISRRTVSGMVADIQGKCVPADPNARGAVE